MILCAVKSIGCEIPVLSRATAALRNDREIVQRLIPALRKRSSVLRVACFEHATDELVASGAAACRDRLEATKRLADGGSATQRERVAALLHDPDGVLALCLLHPTIWVALGLTKGDLLNARGRAADR